MAVLSKGGGLENLSNSQLRLKAITLFEAGYFEREIAETLGKSRSWVAKWKARWRKEKNVHDKNRNGRHKKLSTRGKAMVDRIKYKRGKSTRKVSKELTGIGKSVSHVTLEISKEREKMDIF